IAFQAERGLVGHYGQDHRAGRGDAPRPDPPQRAAVESVLLGQQAAEQAAGIIRLEATPMVCIPGQSAPGPPSGPPNHPPNINRKSAPNSALEPYRPANRFHLRGKTIKDGPKAAP